MSGFSTNSLLKWLIIVSLSLFLLKAGAVLFIPMLYGLLVAFVMYPFCTWVERRGFSRSLAITVSLLIVLSLFAGLLGILFWQATIFRQDLPDITAKIVPALAEFRNWVQEQFSFTLQMQDEWLQRVAYDSGNKVTGLINSVFNATVQTLFMLFMIPIFTALFLYHRQTFVRFVETVFGPAHKQKLQTILSQIVYTYSGYIKGMVLVYLSVGVLNSVGLLALGIRHAVLFGMITAIMTIIPYVGIIISALLPISIAFVTKDSIWYPLGVIGVFAFVQYLEANIIFPAVVGRQLNVSTWATLVAILAGGIVWGVSGMILFIPFVAILKVAAEHVTEWRALYVLLNRND